ncbi:MAG TPA: YbhB/YbcL family Raf kinase inhibitor-like protein [Cyanobacteria bacterium UBA8530]|nr:YbhB/YbcL family Raf kinase inhibitor-like protein [Cyanobacteria bacterium UBA8530]
MALSTQAFADEAFIPDKYAYQGIGQNLSIPFEWTSPPQGTKSLALLIVDLHPIAKNWIHWMVVDLPPSRRDLPEGISGTREMPGEEKRNSFGEKGYGGPMPPPGSGPHLYQTTLFALSVPTLSLKDKPSYQEFLAAVHGKVLAQSSWKGAFQRTQ